LAWPLRPLPCVPYTWATIRRCWRSTPGNFRTLGFWMALKDAAGNETFHRIDAVAQLHLQGWGVPGIAREVGCCQSQVWHDIKMLREFWVDQANQTFAVRQGEELARIAQVEAAAWQKGDLRQVLRCIEMRLKMFKMIGPSVVVQQNVQVNWD